MSKLEQLITELCPDGVEYVELWSITTWDKRFNSVKSDKQPKVISYPYLLAADLFKLEQTGGNVFLLSTGERTGWTTKELAADYLCDGEVVSIPWGKSRPVKEVLKYYKGKFVTADNRIATSNDTNKLLNKFLYYWMVSQGELIDKFYRGSGIKHPSMAAILNMKIPLPPLQVQAEVVRILDNFMKLTAELTAKLTAELAARKKQYEYYRDSLLSFDDEVERKPLGEVCTVQAGGTPSKNETNFWESGTIKWLGSTVCKNKKTVEEITNYITELGLLKSSAKLMKKDSTLIALVGATIGKVAFLPFEATINQNIAGVYPVDDEKILPSYIYYACTMLYSRFLDLGNGKLAMANLSFVRSLQIPLPSLHEQQRIVDILDRFDTICSGISSGLSTEIEARQKQYEYYRDKLLTFPKAKLEV